MPSPADAQTIQSALKDIVTLLIQDLHRLWLLIQGEKLDAVQTRDMLISASPGLVNPYAASAAQMTATWYDQLAPGLAYKATTAPLPSPEQLAANVRWAVTPLFGETSAAKTDDPLVRLAGSMQRAVFNASRNTVVFNADHESGTKWARYASVTACAFCRLLATRTDDSGGSSLYLSEESAERVVGRNGRPRGTQKIGDRYHTNCKCIAVPIRPGDSYEPPDFVNDWEQEYFDARESTHSGDVRVLMREMRKNDIK